MRIDERSGRLIVDGLRPITQGEHNAHAEVVTLPRRLAGYDVAELAVVMRASYPEYDAVMDQVLAKTVEEERVLAVWRITSDFTSYSGRMDLELRLVAAGSESPVIKYAASAPVAVRASEDHSDAVRPDLAESLLVQAESAVERAQAVALEVSVDVGAVKTVEPDMPARIEQSGTSRQLVLDFYLPQGKTGAVGPPGEQGPKGEPGANGASFTIRGMLDSIEALRAARPVGEAGEAWSVGDTTSSSVWLWDAPKADWVDMGPIQGPQGVAGPIGATGESAYEAAVSEGFSGTKAEWLASLKGNRGDKGEPGGTGPIGPQGPQGPPGVSAQDFTATVPAAWVGTSAPYTQNVAVEGITANMQPMISPVYDAALPTALAQKEAWAYVSKAVTYAGGITFTCFEEKPTIAIPIQIKVVG